MFSNLIINYKNTNALMRQKLEQKCFPVSKREIEIKHFFKLRKKAVIKLYTIHSSTMNVIYEKSPVSQFYGETQKETQDGGTGKHQHWLPPNHIKITAKI